MRRSDAKTRPAHQAITQPGLISEADARLNPVRATPGHAARLVDRQHRRHEQDKQGGCGVDHELHSDAMEMGLRESTSRR